MDTTLILLLALLLLPVVAYAHLHLPEHTDNRQQLWWARLILVFLGLAFGWAVMSTYLPTAGASRVWIFLASFGIVHLPAACILLIKAKRQHS